MSDKIYEVPADWGMRAYVDDAKYRDMYRRSIEEPDAFWGSEAKRIQWMKPFSKVKNTSFDPGKVSIKWFEDGTLNVGGKDCKKLPPAQRRFRAFRVGQ